MKSISLFDTLLGQGGVATTDAGVCKVWLPGDDELEGLMAVPSALSEQAAQLLCNYFKGTNQPFEHLAVDLSKVSEFQRRILVLIRNIVYGDVKSYGEVACLAGIAKGARAIGGALAANPVPVIIPCHRVVASNGALTGFTAPGGTGMKKYLLEKEGVMFLGKQIAMKNR